jgi:hypothetical protein
MLFPDVLAKVQATADDTFAKAALVPLLRLVGQPDVLPGSGGSLKEGVASSATYPAVWNVMQVQFTTRARTWTRISMLIHCKILQQGLRRPHSDGIVLDQAIAALEMLERDMLSEVDFVLDDSVAQAALKVLGGPVHSVAVDFPRAPTRIGRLANLAHEPAVGQVQRLHLRPI